MKAMKLILVSILLAGTVSVVCFSACNKEKSKTYTIKGHLYQNSDKIPFKNQTFEFQLFRKKKIYETSKNDYVFEKVLGVVTTDENGYLEFTYKHSSSGLFIIMETDIVAAFKGIDSRLPANQNIEKDFFPPPSCGYADVFVNTNGILKAEDTLYISYEYLCGQSGVQFDTIYGNHTGYFKTINARRTYQKTQFEDEIVGVYVYVGKSKGSSGLIRYDYVKIFPINFPLRNTQQKDSIFIDYEVE